MLLDEERTTNSNGFVGLWLPRDIDATLTITHENGSITTPISTGADDPTCLTDLPLT
ncbi:CueP family metal-binding protein [Microbacterium aurum]